MATQLQSLLRFLSQDAKVPLATAISKVKDLQKSHLDSPEKLAKTQPKDLEAIFPDEKTAKQVLAAAKRISKKRAAGDTDTPSPAKKKRTDTLSMHDQTAISPAEHEATLSLPSSNADADQLAGTTLFTNRAPLALAFVLTLLKHTMPDQPLSSRLSLAQGYVSATARARARHLGIETGRGAEAEGFGDGQPSVRISGKEIKVLRRWGYEDGEEGEGERAPPLWALDLEALRQRDSLGSGPALGRGGGASLPIHTPQAARAYLLQAFETARDDEIDGPKAGAKKVSAAARVAEKERNLGELLRVLDLLYASWAATLTPEELDTRTWGWYVRVRPAVADGVAGWGGKNTVKLAEILALRRNEGESRSC